MEIISSWSKRNSILVSIGKADDILINIDLLGPLVTSLGFGGMVGFLIGYAVNTRLYSSCFLLAAAITQLINSDPETC